MTDWLTTSTVLRDLREYANESAWQRLAASFRAPITRFAARMGLSDSDAEDVAQETLIAFAEAYRAGQYDRAKGRLRHWLFGIAFRQVLSRRRSAARRAQVMSTHAQNASLGMEGEDHAARQWDDEWQEALLEQCLHRVAQEVEPATMRAFERVVRDGRSPADAARELGVPVKAVYNAKYTVLRRLRELRAELDLET